MDNTRRERECTLYVRYTLSDNGRTEWIPALELLLLCVCVMADAGAMRTLPAVYKRLGSKFPLGFALCSLVLRSYIENANISNLQTHTFSLFTRATPAPALCCPSCCQFYTICTWRSQLLPIQSGPSENKDGHSTGLIWYYDAVASNLAEKVATLMPSLDFWGISKVHNCNSYSPSNGAFAF